MSVLTPPAVSFERYSVPRLTNICPPVKVSPELLVSVFASENIAILLAAPEPSMLDALIFDICVSTYPLLAASVGTISMLVLTKKTFSLNF